MPELLPDASYWRRSLQPWMGEWVAIGLRSGAVLSGRLMDVSTKGPILEWPHDPRPVATWEQVQYVEHKVHMLARLERADEEEVNG